MRTLSATCVSWNLARVIKIDENGGCGLEIFKNVCDGNFVMATEIFNSCSKLALKIEK